eukprot:5729201-Pleurochrysis_carterae.AAC.1
MASSRWRRREGYVPHRRSSGWRSPRRAPPSRRRRSGHPAAGLSSTVRRIRHGEELTQPAPSTEHELRHRALRPVCQADGAHGHAPILRL